MTHVVYYAKNIGVDERNIGPNWVIINFQTHRIKPTCHNQL